MKIGKPNGARQGSVMECLPREPLTLATLEKAAEVLETVLEKMKKKKNVVVVDRDQDHAIGIEIVIDAEDPDLGAVIGIDTKEDIVLVLETDQEIAEGDLVPDHETEIVEIEGGHVAEAAIGNQRAGKKSSLKNKNRNFRPPSSEFFIVQYSYPYLIPNTECEKLHCDEYDSCLEIFIASEANRGGCGRSYFFAGCFRGHGRRSCS